MKRFGWLMVSSVAALVLAASPMAAADRVGYPPGDDDHQGHGLIGGWGEKVEDPDEIDVTEPPVEKFTGWRNIEGTWYYLDSDGKMATGWAKIGYSWYGFTSSGAWINGYQSCPSHAPLKGNKASMIYHRPGQMAYNRTVAEECFSSESDAQHAGYRAARR